LTTHLLCEVEIYAAQFIPIRRNAEACRDFLKSFGYLFLKHRKTIFCAGQG